MAVARLFYLDPAKFGRTCKDCASYVFDETTGRTEKNRTDGRPMKRSLTGSFPPCHECPKTARLELKSRSYANITDIPQWCYTTFHHWRESVAVNWTTGEGADPIVRRNAGIFASVESMSERGRSFSILEVLGLIKR